jgi:hypothetical protein
MEISVDVVENEFWLLRYSKEVIDIDKEILIVLFTVGTSSESEPNVRIGKAGLKF